MRRRSGLVPRRRSTTGPGGFTLLELLVVIIIIIMLAGTAVAMMNMFFRGQGVRQGAAIVSQMVAQARQYSAETHRMVFLVLSRQPAAATTADPEGFLEIHPDTPDASGTYNLVYNGDQDPNTNDADPAAYRADLPKYVVFDWGTGSQLAWIAFRPTGYATLHTAGGTPYAEVQASNFDATMNGSSPSPIGDIIIRQQNRAFWMCMDLDRGSGKIRRHFFLAQ
jgi:prepilin-type N-terminal cleavage/methylation domain-containing protein